MTTDSEPHTTPPDLDIRRQVPLAPYTTLGLGGPARYFAECGSEDQVRAALSWARERGLRVAVLGGGSNVVFADGGFPGLVLRVAIGSVEFRDGPAPGVVAGAGAEWDAVVGGAVERGWAGVECLSGIPGSVGGTPIQNVGAYGQEVSQTLVSVACLDRNTLERRVFDRDECGFGYRSSRFKRQDRDRYVVLQVGFRLERDAPPRLEYPELRDAVARTSPLEGLQPVEALRLVRESVLALRRRKSMVLDPADPNTRSAGSFFMNPVVTAAAFAELEARWKSSGRDGRIPAYPAEPGVKLSAAWLVEQAGFAKGYRRGGVGVSGRHALALVNYGGTAAELLALGDAIAGAVAERFGIRLEMEPQIVA
ncbi:MAG TPA: UDP-N-acetylmuramate dehydrogenase [Gemmatimonadales bacterium]|nr:UDP-N-acetylmuramate dehydrogenase [Gemmatimonadales bacterium]